MGIIKGLANIAAATAPREEGEKAKYLKLKDGESVTIRFINELDEESKNFDPARGLAAIFNEYKPPVKIYPQELNPEAFKNRAACLDEDGPCWPRENGWRPSPKFYINVLIDDGIDKEVVVWGMATWKNSNFELLKEIALEDGSISDRTFVLKRRGSGLDTQYLMRDKGVDKIPYDWEGVEPYDLEKVVRQIPYEKQEEFFTKGLRKADSDDKPEPQKAKEESYNW